MREERRIAGGRVLAAQPGVHHIPDRPHAAMAHEPEDPGRVRAGPVRVVGLEQQPYAEVGGAGRGRGEPPGGRGVGLLGALLPAAGEDPDIAGAQVVGELQQLPEPGQHRLVRPGLGGAHISGDGEDLDPGVPELRRHPGPFVRPDPRVHRLLGVGAQLDAVIPGPGGEPGHVGHGHTGDAEGGEGELHTGSLGRGRAGRGDLLALRPGR
ncbi:hypothetical protein GCM10009578_020180 [Streptomyces rhizosphaericus]